jgi:hypothetical protein
MQRHRFANSTMHGSVGIATGSRAARMTLVGFSDGPVFALRLKLKPDFSSAILPCSNFIAHTFGVIELLLQQRERDGDLVEKIVHVLYMIEVRLAAQVAYLNE